MRLRYVNLWEALFPPDLRLAVRRRLTSLGGLTLLLSAGVVGLALASWSALDPSLNHATDRAPTNWLGQPGADVSDLLMQFFGLGSVALVLLAAGWGWRLASGVPLGKPLRRLVATLAGMALAGGVVAGLPAPADWPLAVGLGGVLGEATLELTQLPALALLGAESGLAGPAALALVAALTGAAIWIALAGHGTELAAGRRPGAAIGWAIGALLGVLVALGRGAVWVWRLLFGPGGVDPRERLRIAMARADQEEDLVWANTGELYAPGGRRPKSEPIVARGDPERAEAAPPMRSGLGFLPLLRTLFDFGGKVAGTDQEDRVEPALGRPSQPGSDGEDAADAPEAGAAQPPRKRRVARARQAELELVADGDYTLPPLGLLNEVPPTRDDKSLSEEALQANARALEGVLEDFGVRGEIINVRPGPVVSLYELAPAPGIKSSRVIGLSDDIARSMSAISARVAVIPGRNVIGIELPNERRQTVYLRELFAAPEFENAKHHIALGLGKDIGGRPVIVDLARMPHLLIAGTTGSGKSVGINAMILSALFRMTPTECKLIMIDPKMLELSVYDGIPHLLTPVVTDPKKAIVALKWTVREMEERYKNMSKLGVRNIDGFNKRVTDAAARGETLTRTVQTGFDHESGQAVYETEEMSLEPMPFIIVVVDEMADLMMVAGKDIEGAIQRLAQMARAAGIHLIMATQRPSVDVITGTIKANFPTRVSFQVTSKIDSRTILNEQGAEQLLGQGDMLYMAGGGRIARIHGAFVTDEEVEGVVQFLKRQGVPQYLEAVTEDGADDGEDGAETFDEEGGSDDLYDRAVAIVARDRKASTSYVQRRLSIGYNRAATIIERMEAEGVVGQANHAGKREVLVPEADY